MPKLTKLEQFFSDDAIIRLLGYPAVYTVVLDLVDKDQIPAARLLAFVTRVADQRGDQIDALRKEIGLRPTAHDSLGRINRK